MVFKLPWKRLTLIHPVTKKTWYIEVDGTIIRSCLNNGKVIEKSEKYTADKAVQKVMEKLRKGFVCYHTDSHSKERIKHTFLGSSYTGFMPIAAREDRDDFYVLRVVKQFEDELLYHYTADGTLLSTVHLGADRMTYHAILNEDGTLYFDKSGAKSHHVIECYDPCENKFLPLDRTDNSKSKV